jgi:uncharacterized membrane protein
VPVHELLDLVFRWAHLIAGIMWIGNSMLFNWLDRNLIAPPADDQHRLSQGKIYMVHSGAFYEVEKKLLEPNQLPRELHWFKWQNGITWMTGISLLVIVYYFNGAAFLIDPDVHAMSQNEAIGISVGALVAGWAIYDAIWRFVANKPVATALSFALLFGAAFSFTQLFSGRAAFIETGVLMGTIMTGNVWMRILPSQRSLIAATKEGKQQDATLSKRAKERSIHNNYLTFPLLFIMLSNHFPSVTGSHWRWWLLVIVLFGGAGVRHFMNIRYAGKMWLWPALVVGAVTLTGLMTVTRIEVSAPAPKPTHAVDFNRASEIIALRCVPCHDAHPSNPVGAAVPADAHFDSPAQITRWAPKMLERLSNNTMPMNNLTGMTPEERGELEQWIQDGAKP